MAESTVTKTLPDGTSVQLPAHLDALVRGVDADGDLVAAGDWTKEGEPEFLYLLTPCCQASGKGLSDEATEEGYVGCRACYQEVDPKFGGILRADEIKRFI